MVQGWFGSGGNRPGTEDCLTLCLLKRFMLDDEGKGYLLNKIDYPFSIYSCGGLYVLYPKLSERKDEGQMNTIYFCI